MVMATSSSSVTPMKKKRYMRRMSLIVKLHLLLQQGSRHQPPPTLLKHPRGCKMIIVMIAPLIGRLTVAAMVEMKPVRLRLPRQGGTYGRHASRRSSMVVHCYSISSFMQRSGDGDAESLMYFNTHHASCSFSISVTSLM
jgi:hypothetical protein